MVIREGDPLLGSNVAFLRFGGCNAAGQIAFRADLLASRKVIVVGTRSAVNPWRGRASVIPGAAARGTPD